MLDLKSSLWGELNHAYGKATNLPELLMKLSAYPPHTNEENEPYFSLWSALCHQGDVFTASYAAVPHIIDLAMIAPDRAHWDFIYLPACIEVSRLNSQGPKIPEKLAEDYTNAIGLLPEVVAKMQKFQTDENFTLAAATAIAAACGQVALAEAYMELTYSIVPEFLEWASEQ